MPARRLLPPTVKTSEADLQAFQDSIKVSFSAVDPEKEDAGGMGEHIPDGEVGEKSGNRTPDEGVSDGTDNNNSNVVNDQTND